VCVCVCVCVVCYSCGGRDIDSPKGPGGEVWLRLRSFWFAVFRPDRRGPCGLGFSNQWVTIGEALPLTCANTSGSRRGLGSLHRGGGTVADDNSPTLFPPPCTSAVGDCRKAPRDLPMSPCEVTMGIALGPSLGWFLAAHSTQAGDRLGIWAVPSSSALVMAGGRASDCGLCRQAHRGRTLACLLLPGPGERDGQNSQRCAGGAM